MNRTAWIARFVPSCEGRRVVITGGNSGIGFETAKVFVESGARVTLACRSLQKGQAAADRLNSIGGAGRASAAVLDLASLSSVRAFAGQLVAAGERIDLLINNAGVMVPPLSRTAEGFELQFGVNHLAHFALTGLLVPLLRGTPGSRIVNVSSLAHRAGDMDFNDLNWERTPYRPWRAYGRSKLANLLFTFELQRRLSADGADMVCTASHPGWTATNLMRNAGFMRAAGHVLAMPPWKGALPTVLAAVATATSDCRFFGPGGPGQINGFPREVSCSARSRDEGIARELWSASEGLTGVTFLSAVPR